MKQTGVVIICFYLGSVWATRCYMIYSMKKYQNWYAPETWWLPLINLILVAVMVLRRIDLNKFSIYKWWTGGF